VRLATTADNIGRFPRPGMQDDLNIYLGMGWPSRQGKLGGPKQWEELELIPVITPDGKRVLAGSLLTGSVTQEAVSIIHKNGRRTATVLAKALSRTAGDILQEFLPQLQEMQQNWPEGYDYTFAGEAEASQETYSKSGIALVIAVFLVFGTLSLLFDSFKQPFIIMFSVPFGLIGTFFGFFLAGIPISFPAMIGIISLVGITVNDAIVMIETMNIRRESGLPVKDAAARGAADRLRPILSTSITTIVGLIPLALSSPGWMPLCNAIIFGLIASTLVSLFIIPCFFVLLTPENKNLQEA
jgi:multidrug efflux pump subunit AcrB